MLLEKVQVVLNYVKEEDLENVFKRHDRLARATLAGVQAIVLSMVAPDNPADSVQWYLFPMAWIVKSLRDDYGITLLGGQDQWKGKVVHIAPGYVDTFDIIIAISVL